MPRIRFSFIPQIDRFRPADTSVPESERPRIPLSRHVDKDIPITDEQGNRIGLGKVTGMSLRTELRGPQHIEVGLDIEFDNPLRALDIHQVDGMHFSIGPDPDEEPQPIPPPVTPRRPHGDVLVLKPRSGTKTFELVDEPMAEARAAWGVVQDVNDYDHFLVYDLRNAALLGEGYFADLREALFTLATFHPSSTVVVARDLAHRLMETAHLSDMGLAEQAKTQAQNAPGNVAVKVARFPDDDQTWILPVSRGYPVSDVDYVVARMPVDATGKQALAVRGRTSTGPGLAGRAEDVPGLADVLKELREACDPYDITVALDPELAKQVISERPPAERMPTDAEEHPDR